MILKGMNSKNLILKGFGFIQQVIEALRRVSSIVVKVMVQTVPVRVVRKVSRVIAQRNGPTIIKSIFKRR